MPTLGTIEFDTHLAQLSLAHLEQSWVRLTLGWGKSGSRQAELSKVKLTFDRIMTNLYWVI